MKVRMLDTASSYPRHTRTIAAARRRRGTTKSQPARHPAPYALDFKLFTYVTQQIRRRHEAAGNMVGDKAQV